MPVRTEDSKHHSFFMPVPLVRAVDMYADISSLETRSKYVNHATLLRRTVSRIQQEEIEIGNKGIIRVGRRSFNPRMLLRYDTQDKEKVNITFPKNEFDELYRKSQIVDETVPEYINKATALQTTIFDMALRGEVLKSGIPGFPITIGSVRTDILFEIYAAKKEK